ncbi:MAG: Ubiquinone biosynthesis O-methyltransferase [Candidatus Heimdallarchaeota archaeon LC_2]|nr:MAG: Ubiquinone biosynthesis O-methyltransferase [Candidatus Heimdallarchaeota archaeon LC_2]
MENFNESSSSACFYCQEYHAIYSDVPLNEVITNINGITPRCFLHYQYECSTCELNIHFNGISWCHECRTFTCIDCGKEKIKNRNFLIYNYYFEISCINCGTGNPALDYAEYSGNHPYQIGDLWPNQPMNIWLPMNNNVEIETKPYTMSGTQRIQQLSSWTINTFEIQTNDDPSNYNIIKDWTKFLGRNHRILLTNFVLPEMLKMISVKPEEKILEIGCGEGELCRIIAKSGAIVTGIDISKIITAAIDSNKNGNLDITYLKANLEDLKEKSETSKFDKIVSNLKIMTIEKLSVFFENVFHNLKIGGDFIFSVSHPFFSLPNGFPVRIPADSRRNEDKFWMMDNYFKEGPVRIFENGIQIDPVLIRRTLSNYLNNMTSIGFSLIEISEPQVNLDLIANFPNQFHNNDDRTPVIMIIKARKF